MLVIMFGNIELVKLAQQREKFRQMLLVELASIERLKNSPKNNDLLRQAELLTKMLKKEISQIDIKLKKYGFVSKGHLERLEFPKEILVSQKPKKVVKGKGSRTPRINRI